MNSHYGTQDGRHPFESLLKGIAAWPAGHVGEETRVCVPNADVGNPCCERVERGKKGRPPLAQTDIGQARLARVNLRLELRENLFKVLRLPLYTNGQSARDRYTRDSQRTFLNQRKRNDMEA